MFRRFIVQHKEKLKEYKIIGLVKQDDYHSTYLMGIDETNGDIVVLDSSVLKFVRWADTSNQELLHEIRFGFENLNNTFSLIGIDEVKENMKQKPKALKDKIITRIFNFLTMNKYVIIKKK